MSKSKEKAVTVDKSINLTECTVGGVSKNTLEAVSKLADVLIANAEAVKQLSVSIKSEIHTGIYIGQARD